MAIRLRKKPSGEVNAFEYAQKPYEYNPYSYSPYAKSSSAGTQSGTNLDDVGQLKQIMEKAGYKVEDPRPKLSWLNRLIALGSADEPTPIAQYYEKQQAPTTVKEALVKSIPYGPDFWKSAGQYAGSIGRRLKSAVTGKEYRTPEDIESFSDIYKRHGVDNKYVAGGMGLASDIFLSPSTYIGFGTAGGLKVGGKTLTRAGKKALKETAEQVATKTIQEVAESSGKKLSKSQVVQDLIQKAYKGTGEVAERVLKKPQYIDQGGLKVLGQTVGGTRLEQGIKKIGGKVADKTGLGKLLKRDYGLPEAYTGMKQSMLDMSDNVTRKAVDDTVSLLRGTNKIQRETMTRALDEGTTQALKGSASVVRQGKVTEVPLRKIASDIAQEFKQIAKYEKRAGVLDTARANYVTHLYKDPVEAKKILAQMTQGVKPGTRFAKAREIPSIRMAEQLGLKPELDIANILATRKVASQQALQESKFLSRVQGVYGVPKTITGESVSKVIPDKLATKSQQALFTRWKKTGEALGKANKQMKEYANLLASKQLSPSKYNELLSQAQDTIQRLTQQQQGYAQAIKSIPLKKSISTAEQITNPVIAGMTANGVNLVEYHAKGIGKNILLPDVIAKDLKALGEKAINDEAINQILKAYDQGLRFFKGSVTSFFPSFHGRNAISNVMQNTLDVGIQSVNPKRWAESIKVLVKKSPEGVLKTDIGTKYSLKEIKNLADELGVSGSAGYFDVKVAPGQMLTQGMKGRLKQIPGAVKGSGLKLGHAIENQARMLNFISNLRKGLSPQDAAKHVKDYLFDYGNLSKFEQEVMRRIIPFYTWNRKNLELIAKTMIKTPYKITAQTKAIKEIEKTIGGEQGQEEAKYYPDWLQEKLAIPLQGERALSGFGIPLEAFAEKLEVKNALNDIAPFLKMPLEMATDQSFYKDEPISEDNNGYFAKDYPKWLQQFLEYKETPRINKSGGTWIDYSVNPMRAYLLRNVPTGQSRILSTYSKLADADQKTLDKYLAFLTGIKIYGQDYERNKYNRDKEKQAEYEAILEQAGLLDTYQSKYVPKDIKQKLGI